MQYSNNDEYRLIPIPSKNSPLQEKCRSPWRRDFARLIHSAAFRRLQGKTQLFPGQESDFFRNRLTHSLEVSQIAKSIAIKLNHELKASHEKYEIDTDIVEFAGLAHDLGHPPFGHFGEGYLNKNMLDFGGFESNAQALRILAVIEKRHPIKNTTLGITKTGVDRRVGLNLTMRSLASILKYDVEIPTAERQKKRISQSMRIAGNLIKGYYNSESCLVKIIKERIINGKKLVGRFKTIECQIMDIADDIAYSTYDLEDSFKAEFIKPLDLICADKNVVERVAHKVNKSLGTRLTEEDIVLRIEGIFFGMFDIPWKFPEKTIPTEILPALHLRSIKYAKFISDDYSSNAYYRTELTSGLVSRFIGGVTIDQINRKIPALSTVKLDKNIYIDVEILKNIVYELQIMSPRIQVAAKRSKEIIDTIFHTLSEKNGQNLLPSDYHTIYNSLSDRCSRMRLICDFIAGMTDRYSIEFYGRITSETPETIFKPY